MNPYGTALVREHRKSRAGHRPSWQNGVGQVNASSSISNGKPSYQLEKALIAARAFCIDLGDLKTAATTVIPTADDALAHQSRFSWTGIVITTTFYESLAVAKLLDRR